MSEFKRRALRRETRRPKFSNFTHPRGGDLQNLIIFCLEDVLLLSSNINAEKRLTNYLFDCSSYLFFSKLDLTCLFTYTSSRFVFKLDVVYVFASGG